MRDIVLMSMVLTAALVALRRPWIGVMLWIWLSLMNPHRYTFGFAFDAPVAMIAAASTMIGLLGTKDRGSPMLGLPVSLLVAFTVWMTVSWLMGFDPSGDYEQWKKVIKINFFLIILLMLVRTKMQIFVLVAVSTFSIALLGAKGGVFTVLTGGSYRVWGPPDSFVAGNNEFALAVIMTIPLLRFLQLQATNKALRQLLLVMMVLCAAAALGSHSRGALLAIAAMGGLLWWRGKSRVMGGIVIVLVAAAAYNFMPAEWFERMETIETYKEDNSALGRFSAWWVSYGVAKDHFFGAGFSITDPNLFAIYSPYPQLGTPVAHSIWFQVLGHHGFVGLLLFILMWLATWRMAARMRRDSKAIPEARWVGDLGSMAQVSLIGYLIGGAFLSLAYFDLPYYVMAAVVTANLWFRQQAWKTEAAPKGRWAAWVGLAPPAVPAPPQPVALPPARGAPGVLPGTGPGARPPRRPGPVSRT
jgi:putative inorganic carbon (hco3(-)) transporter